MFTVEIAKQMSSPCTRINLPPRPYLTQADSLEIEWVDLDLEGSKLTS